MDENRLERPLPTPDPPDLILGVREEFVRNAPSLYWFMVTRHDLTERRGWLAPLYWLQAADLFEARQKAYLGADISEKKFLEPTHPDTKEPVKDWVKRTGSPTFLHFHDGRVKSLTPVRVDDLEFFNDGEQVQIANSFSTRSMTLFNFAKEGVSSVVVERGELMELIDNRKQKIQPSFAKELRLKKQQGKNK